MLEIDYSEYHITKKQKLKAVITGIGRFIKMFQDHRSKRLEYKSDHINTYLKLIDVTSSVVKAWIFSKCSKVLEQIVSGDS